MMAAEIKPEAAGPRMVTGFGQSDTHAIEISTNDGPAQNQHPSAGMDYRTITARDIAAMAKAPDSRDKSDAQWFIGSDYVAHDARSHAAQREKGMFHVLPVDIDKGGPSLEAVTEAARNVAGQGNSFIVYSSSSATAEDPKWRVLFFASSAVAGIDYKDTQEAIFSLFADQGITCDPALSRTGQLVFLPNVPKQKRDEAGSPLFYQYHLERGHTLDLTNHRITQRREAVRADVQAAIAEAAQRRSRSTALTTGDEASPVTIFNERHNLADLLEKYGYTRQGQSDNWQSPNQSSGSYAVRTFEGKSWVSLSGSDQAAAIGAQKDYCCYGDAFDLFVHYEHGGDYKNAVRTYGQIVKPSATVVPLRPVPDPDDLSADFGAAEQDVEKADPKPHKTSAETGLTDWVFLSGDNEFYETETGRVMGLTAFNLAMSPVTPKIEIFKADGEVIEKKFSAAKTLIDHMEGTVAHSTMYRPDLPDQGQDVFCVGGVPFINSYMTASVPGIDPQWASREEWKTCETHITNILGDNAPVVVQWMAHNVQHPGRKILWAPIIVGVQGDGKTTLAKMLGAAMGAQNVSPVSPETMFSDFTGWAEGACVKVLEEIRVHGNSRHDAMNKLKPLITNDTVEVVRKGKDGKQVINVTNYMALTNYMDALALDDGDRRWGVFKTKFDDRADMLAEFDDSYWKALHNAIDHHPDVVRGWLMSVPLDGFNRVAGPEISDHKKAMIDATKPADQMDVEEAIEIGWHGVTQTVLATDCLNAALQANSGQKLNTKRLSAALDQAGWVKLDGQVKWNGVPRRLWFKKGSQLGAADPRELREILDTSDTTGGL